jgi:hypothetical protein
MNQKLDTWSPSIQTCHISVACLLSHHKHWTSKVHRNPRSSTLTTYAHRTWPFIHHGQRRLFLHPLCIGAWVLQKLVDWHWKQLFQPCIPSTEQYQRPSGNGRRILERLRWFRSTKQV